MYVSTKKVEHYVLKLQDIKTPELTLKTIRIMLNTVTKMFDKYDVTYWMDGGTLLGALRHQDVIPWDDDADLAMPKSSIRNFLTIKNVLLNFGYEISEFFGGYKIFPAGGQQLVEFRDNTEFKYKFPFIDIFIVATSDNVVHYDNDDARDMWPDAYHNIADLYPLTRYKFANFTMWGPQNPAPYLSRLYGQLSLPQEANASCGEGELLSSLRRHPPSERAKQDWLTTAYLQWDHKNMRPLDTHKFKIVDIEQ